MLRLRRYRVFLALAVFIVVLFVRISRKDDLTEYARSNIINFRPHEKTSGEEEEYLPVKTKDEALKPQWTPRPSIETEPLDDLPKEAPKILPETKSPPKPISGATSLPVPPPSAPQFIIPDREPSSSYGRLEETEDDIHPIPPPGRQELPEAPPEPEPTIIHWEKFPEHFPVAAGSLIPLPTGKPMNFPKIQHVFNDETIDARITREKRQENVKQEFKRAWAGYRSKAWMHDELSPVSGKSRDPFCGWAATLVDALDTLWIMGLEEEFEEAVRAVALIDFTTTLRSKIPVFETTIRYLGGLLAAYDVSGGKHKELLDKAVELADILMGAFDTPNRMPILHYMWKPAFASQPHRANYMSNLAELGSLSLEFTRLAQLTQDNRYYDAVARVTNALSEWQDRGTRINGVFPEFVDASGCNRTADVVNQKPISSPSILPSKDTGDAKGYQPTMPQTVREPKPKKGPSKQAGDLEFTIVPGEPSKGHIVNWDAAKKAAKRSTKRDMEDGSVVSEKTPPLPHGRRVSPHRPVVDFDRVSIEESCKPQGLQPGGQEKFSMGGGQDSTYEYFPKEYMLLGGLEPVYKKMYSKTIDAVRQHMLYRPMVPGDRNILSSGALAMRGMNSDFEFISEVEHLTCFLGGMVGLGAKLFEIEGDLDIAKKLTDGCVWAYENTPTRIMPEGGSVIACKSAQHCSWNQTLYEFELDPAAATRDQDVVDYLANKKLTEEVRKKDEEARRIAAEEKKALAEKFALEEPRGENVYAEHSDGKNSSSILEKESPAFLQKRQSTGSPASYVAEPSTRHFNDDVSRAKNPADYRPASVSGSSVKSESLKTPADLKYQQKSEMTEAELQSFSGNGRQKGEVPLGAPADPRLSDPARPFNHSEYVASRILRENLPPGYTIVRSPQYILRPEAIESIWYMYRITGESIWQDKGWDMFTSIINATSTPYGHSAILDVTAQPHYQIDEMESFWLSETLKYFYLLYSTPDTISLDDWVLNTEAHPFRRPT